MNSSEKVPSPFPNALLWSLWLLAAAIAFKSFNVLDSDYDLFWHLLMGEDILKNGMVRRFDIYSFTASGHFMVNHEWLSQVIMTCWYRLGGEWGLICFRWMMVLSIVGLALKLIGMHARSGLNRVVVFLCFVLVIRPGMGFRVHLFTTLLLLLLMHIICSEREQKRHPSIFGVSLLFLFWANLHGAFMLGLLVWYCHVGEFMLKTPTRSGVIRSMVAMGIPTLVTLINPFGISLWHFVINEVLNPVSGVNITEWQRFSFAPRELPFFGVCVATWIAYLTSKRPNRLFHTAMLLGATVLGFMAVRNTPLFVVLALPVMAAHFDGVLDRVTQFSSPNGRDVNFIWVSATSGFFTVMAVLFFLMGIPESWRIDVQKDPLPFQSVNYLTANKMTGNLWVPLHWGGYVLFHLYPQVRVSIDGRWTMVYDRRVMQDNMDFAYHGQGGKWKTILARYKADYALVEHSNPSFAEMANDADWTFAVIYGEGGILVKRDFPASLSSPLRVPTRVTPSWP